MKRVLKSRTGRHGRFLLLDGLRGVAALGVMTRHLWLASNGWVGLNILVDFFFLLSGFVLGKQLVGKDRLERSAFIKKRILRLFPILIPVILVVVISERISILHHHDQLLVHSLPEYVGAFLLLQLFIPRLIGVNDPLWSLSAEFTINVVASFITTSLSRIRQMIVLGVAVELLGIFLNQKYQLGWGFNQNLIAFGRALSGFYAGIHLYVIRERKEESHRSIGFVMPIILVISTGYLLQFSVYFILLAVPVFYLLIDSISGVNENDKPSWLKNIVKLLGKFSYPIYVWHLVISRLRIPQYLSIHLLHLRTNTWSRTLFNGFVTLICVYIVSDLSIRFIESPIKSWQSRREALSKITK